ncbi:MAG: bifunctional glutamate N-acetyltransferase/amino-acid acetyltransferase ArgJ [Gammaproteobacteria bacterium]|jgi:glutamate N-acetyltransferase / amino-acid N-acetyltransferase|nr:bifunctional glutamate N-acetyltransferase/amino-acid acetyltransferase ArgJ [Gammaproteobacteria bacterium]MBT4492748.1 bifunctional glutamate N-acetyltransferase/amino-acid acetyltransferase ArgJ [Gammaproteobacteria bacterium]MBT7370343.1 bifunctional glutamate N-acetyltransferase/amino-acid acetyltransferase ArgJ [Gammaproteobacteria bacterium]
MAVGPSSTEFKNVGGVRLACAACGIKGDDQLDLVLFEFAEGSVTAGIFTQSAFAAAPVLVGRRHLQMANSRYFLINSGNANAATGDEGVSDAEGCCKALSQRTGARPEEVIPFSTGVIGEKLQVEQITNALPDVAAGLDEGNWLQAATGIMTTDTRPKICSRQFEIEGQTVTITGIAKGAGMIQPNMATMLSYIATDGRANSEFLNAALLASAEQSFNRITVDGDTSTNDSCMLTATGATGIDIDTGNAAITFQAALDSLMQELAHGIVRDAEGATKFVAVEVKGCASEEDCLKIAYSIANSPLIKTALFASDANWGRIVMAIGKAGVPMDISKIDVYVGDVRLMLQGGKDPDYREEAGAAVMKEEEITITVDLNAGDSAETVWTSDLSHDYVSINADYRT